ncbi:MAG: hypothetical protein QM820_64070 [Minicystis sp.]
MIHDDEPTRLLDAAGAPASLRAALEAGRADLPDAARLARLAARLPLGGPPAPSSPPDAPDAPPSPQPPFAPAAPLAPAAVPSALSGVVAGAALALAVVGGAWWHESAKPPPPAPIVGAPTITPAFQSRPEPARPDPAARPIAPEPTAARVEPPPAAAAPAPSALHAPRAAAAPSALASAAAPADPAPSLAAGAAPPAPAVEPESEVALLQRAQDALGGNPARALAITTDHAQRFPRGSLSQEREVIAVSALAALGRTGEARARAASFLARFPESAHRSRLLAIVPGLADALQKNDDPR